jgi:hypothetical protein
MIHADTSLIAIVGLNSIRILKNILARPVVPKHNCVRMCFEYFVIIVVVMVVVGSRMTVYSATSINL